jgi:hypothetical protein
MSDMDLRRAAPLLRLRNAEASRVEEATPISAMVIDYDAALSVAVRSVLTGTNRFRA